MDLIPFEEAYSIVMNSASGTGDETVDFTASLGRVLREDIKSDIDMPPFNKATVDGFACRKRDLRSELELIETIAAGYAPVRKVLENQCSKIMTGAVIPAGADMVFMVEDSSVLASGKIRYTGSYSKDNVALRGEDVRYGDTVLEKGRLIKPQHIAMMAAVGSTSVKVGRKPVVAVISSGNELVEPDKKPGISKIRNTNSFQLMAQIDMAGSEGKYFGIVGDEKEEAYTVISRAISQCDVVLITGGVSMGDFDYIPGVLEKAGVKILFTRVNIQPGKPTTFGIHKKALVFGLPGNPVSAFIQFELLVRPLLCKMAGYHWDPPVLEMPLAISYTRRSTDRRALIPVIITGDGMALPVEYHGSAHISAFSHATGIIAIPEGVSSVEKGEIVSVRRI